MKILHFNQKLLFNQVSFDQVLFDIGMLLMGLADPIRKEMTKYFIGDTRFAELNKLLADFKLFGTGKSKPEPQAEKSV